jgi:uncharacterized protein YbjT (DUF2867 family)
MRAMTEARQAWVIGATGLVGREAVLALLEDETCSGVLAVVRRSSGVSHPKLREKVVDFEDLEPQLRGGSASVAVCCLGTTIKQAGSQAQFRHIELDYSLAFARAARAAGVQHFLVVTALGADAKSMVFYNRVKGELEQQLSALGFPALTIVRPSLLVGDRKEVRLGERIGAPLMKFLPRSIRGIEATKVGRALATYARLPASGKRIVLSKELHAF